MMKKVIYSMFALAMMAFAFISCEDVPAPYDIPNGGGSGEVVTPTVPSGTGTLADPFNVAAAEKYVTDGGDADAIVYVKGVISSIKEIDTGQFGNASYYISDNGETANQFYVYRGYALGKKKFTSENEITVGDTVIVCGKLINFNGTHEFAQGSYIVYQNGQIAGGGESGEGTPEGKGTKNDPYNVAAAHKYIKDGGSGEVAVYVKGKISKLGSFNSQYGNYAYYISDDGTEANQLYVFRGLYLNEALFTSENQIKVGDEVVVCGKLVDYNGTHEFAQGNYLVSINGQTSGGSTLGTYDAPYDVTAALTAGSQTGVYVKGYIVGYVYGTKYDDGATFGADTCTVETNMLIAASAEERNKAVCMPVQLPRGDIRSGLNVSANKGNIGKEVILYGNIATYFNVPGVKAVTYAELGGTAIGVKP